ncbi:MAG: hypothetical protein C4522_19655 [Desulfobacteraceae bacterium]|nr:MAG: hypothetical protein C4522_19655 [Desulfobacteraceae bacterium]
MTTERDLLAARLFLQALFPVMKVVLSDVQKMKNRFQDVTAKIQFAAQNGSGEVGAYLDFQKGNLEIIQGICPSPDIRFGFGSVKKMNDMLAGKPVIPRIKGFLKIRLLIKMFSLLLSLKILMPNAKPTAEDKKRLKIKMTIYMITTALSQYNKGGDPEMVRWTSKQPERIYQMSVDNEDIAAYLRVKAGKTKAGRGFYKKRRPFVHMRFNGIDGALPVILNEVDMVTAVKNEYLRVEGSPEYGRDVGDFMMRIQNMIT